MRKIILICSCFNMEKRAREAFTLIYPNEVSPEVVKGRDRIGRLADELKSQHLKAISRLSGKFAFYVSLDDDNEVLEEYDLLTGRRTA